MTFLDIILGGLLIYGLIKGFLKGLFVELGSFVSLIIGIYVAMKFSYLVRSIISDWVSLDPKYVEMTAFAVTFILVIIGIVLIAKFLTTLVEFVNLGWLNRLAGAIFGVLKIVLILSFALHYFQKLNYNNFIVKREIVDNSLFFNPILQVSNTVFPIIGEWFPNDMSITK